MILFSTTTAFALEIVYPTLPGVEAPQVFMPKIESGEYPRDQALPLYLKYFYVLFVVFSGLIAFAALAYGGFIYLTSSGNPGRVSDAKDQIVSAFFGVIILLGSYMFLLVLNPDLIVLQVPGLQRASFPPMPPFTLPPQKTYTYWELPLGTIEEILLKKNEIAKIAALPLKDASIVVNQKTQEFNSLLSQCKCSRLDSVCSLSSCVDGTTCAGTYTQLCPNATLIASKRQELLSALTNLKAKREDVYIKTVALFKEDLRMRYTQSFLDNCRAEPFDVFTFIEMQEDKTIGSLIKKKRAWSGIDPGKNPLTFYCQLEEDFVNYSVQNWQEAIAEFSAALEAGGSDGEPPGPPPLPNPGALAWPVSNPVVGQPFCQYCGNGGRHWGIDLNFGNAEGTPIYAAADGIVTRVGSICCAEPCCGRPGCIDSPCMNHLGNYVSIQHEIQGKTYTTDYFHLSSISVNVGQQVTQGQVIGTMGNTCTCSVHLHFALREGSTYTNPCLFLPDAGTGSQCLTGIGCKQDPGTCPNP